MYGKENNFRFVWFRNSKLFILKNESANTIIIEDENNLSNLIQ